MPKSRASPAPGERDLKKLRKLLSLAITDLGEAHRDDSLLKSGSGRTGKPPPTGEENTERYDLKKIDAFVDILSRCDRLRRELYNLPTPKDIQDMEKQRRLAEAQDSASGVILLSPVESQDTECPEVDS